MRKKKKGKNHLYMKPEKYSILVNITKKKKTHRYREQTSGYHRGGGRGNTGVGGWEVQTIGCNIDSRM